MQLRSVQTQDRILQSARQLFTAQGFEHTGVDQICRNAGISKGAFYHHFCSKDDLFLRLLEEWTESIHTQINQRFDHSASIQEGFLQTSRSLKEIIDGSSNHLPLLFEFWQHSVKDPVLWEKAVRPLFQFKAHFLELIKRGIKNQEIEVRDPELIADTILAFSFGIIASSMLDTQQDWGRVSSYGFSAIFNQLGGNDL